MIKPEGGKFVLYSKDGKKKLGVFGTEAEAKKHEQQVNFFKHRGSRASLDGEMRTEKYQGRDHLVVPVVALMEGVIHASNAETPELVLAEEFSKNVQSWNGRPIMYNHPSLDGQQISANSPKTLEDNQIGTVFNARVKDKKLLVDAYLDVEKMNKMGEHGVKMLTDVQSGKLGEVSVGTYVTTEPRTGNLGDKKFDFVWRDISSDHLAFLPEGITGACSIEMGCGAGRAASEAELVFTEPELKAACACEEKTNPNDKSFMAAGLPPWLKPKGKDKAKADDTKDPKAKKGKKAPPFQKKYAGGAGSGNFGHGGRPGEVGGSGAGQGYGSKEDKSKHRGPIKNTPLGESLGTQMEIERTRAKLGLNPKRPAGSDAQRGRVPGEVSLDAAAEKANTLSDIAQSKDQGTASSYEVGKAHEKAALAHDKASKMHAKAGAHADASYHANKASNHRDRAIQMGVTPRGATQVSLITPRAASCGCSGSGITNASAEDGSMDKKARVAAIIASGKTCFKTADAAALEGISDEALAHIEQQVKAASSEEPPKEPETEVEEQPAALAPEVQAIVDAAAAEAKKTPEQKRAEFLKANPDIEDMVGKFKAAEKNKKDGLIAELKTAQQVYSETELSAMGIEQLEKLKALAVKPKAPVRDFGGQTPRGAGSNADDNRAPAPPSMADRIRTARGIKTQEKSA